MKLTALFLGLLAVPVAIGCSAPTEETSSADEALVAPAPLAPGKFDLYRQPHYAPESGCVQTTKLELKGMSAHLEEAFSGECELEIALFPNTRDYQLRRAGTSCGSQVYRGKVVKDGEIRDLELIDHRTRVCRDLVPAQIIVKETVSSQLGVIEITQYSNDQAPTESTVEGELASVMGIGGESTGYALMTEAGMVELILDPGEANQFVDGKRARVKGKKTTLTGVETGVRPALDVRSMLVCPDRGWVNCMPGPGVRLSNLCAAENRSWVQANCEGVDYAD